MAAMPASRGCMVQGMAVMTSDDDDDQHQEGLVPIPGRSQVDLYSVRLALEVVAGALGTMKSGISLPGPALLPLAEGVARLASVKLAIPDNPAVARALAALSQPQAAGPVVRVTELKAVAVLTDEPAPSPEAGAPRTGNLTPVAVLLLALVWLVAIGLPVAQVKLPADMQVIIADELATIGLALVVTDRIRKKKD